MRRGIVLIAVAAVHWTAHAATAPLRMRLPPESFDTVRVEGFLLTGDDGLTPFEPSWSIDSEESRSILTIREGCDPKKTYVITTDDRIAFVKPGDCSAVQTVDPAPAVSVPLVVDGIDAPFVARIDVLSCTSPRESGTLLGHFRMTGDTDGSGVLRLPARCVQPQIRVAGFAPHRSGSLELRAQEPPGPVRVHLRRGGSVAAQIVTSSMEPVSGVDVAVDDGSTTDGAHGAETFAAALLQGKSDAHGWVFLDGVRPGNVHLHARPVERLPQTTETYAVRAGEEITLDPIVLAAPARITVRVDAGRELFDEGLKLLGVQLTAEKVAARRLEPLRENISAANSVRFPPVLPGSWRVAVVGRLPGTTAMELASTTVTLHEGEEAMVELPVRHRVYHGRFTGISESLDSAVLVLRPLEKGPAFTLRLDASGRFGVPLEAAAEYSAALDLKDHSQAFEIDSIRFTDPAEELEIPLPSAEVRGMVVETNGRPVAGATIVAEVGELNPTPTERPRSTRARSREDGSFVFSYAESGRWTLAAETAGLASDRLNVAVGDGRRVSGLTLTMAPKVTIQGAVEGSAEMLRRGLSVTFWPVSGTPGEPAAPKVASTDATGRFEFSLMSRGITMGDFVVESRDGLVAAVRSAIPSKAPVVVRLPASTGGMRFERPSGAPWPRFASTLQRLIAPDGAQVPFYAVSRSVSDTIRIIPALAAGTWRFAEAVTPAEIFRLLHGTTEGLVTATFEIIPGREGRIEIRTR